MHPLRSKHLLLIVLSSTFLFFMILGCENNNNTSSNMDAGQDGGSKDSESESETSENDAGEDASTDSGCDGGSGDGGVTTGDGTCEAAGELVPGVSIEATTVGAANDLYDYSCTSLDESGPDLAYSFTLTGDSAARITISLTELNADLDLFVLLEECSDDACGFHSASQGQEEVSAIFAAGASFFVVVDGYKGDSGSFTLSLVTEQIETDCDDGFDDDDDTLTDCYDPDCEGVEACVQTCFEDATVGCNQTILDITVGFENDIFDYVSLGPNYPGPDKVFLFSHDLSGVEVHSELTNSVEGLELLVLSPECSSDALVHHGDDAFVFLFEPDSDFFFVVDGESGAEGAFELTVSCLESNCNDETDNDGDGFYDCEDSDCSMSEACALTCDLLSETTGCLESDEGSDGGVDAGDDGGIDAGTLEPEEGCYLLSPSPLTGFCYPAGETGPGEPCTEPYDCVPGAICTPANICLFTCDLLDGIPACEDGDCTSLGIDPLGVCW